MGKYIKKPKKQQPAEKICTKCLKVKAIADFFEIKGKNKRITAKCKLCYKDDARIYRKKNRERIRAYDRKYNAERRANNLKYPRFSNTGQNGQFIKTEY